MLRYVVMVVGLLVILVAMVVVGGLLLPREHQVTRTAAYRATPAQLFALIRNVNDYPAWQKSVSKVEALPDVEGRPSFRETNSGQAITYELSNITPDQGMVSTIVGDKLPFGGSWTYEISAGPVANATTLRITENGVVYNPVFRFVSKFVMGHSATIDKYLAAVATRVPRLPGSD